MVAEKHSAQPALFLFFLGSFVDCSVTTLVMLLFRLLSQRG